MSTKIAVICLLTACASPAHAQLAASLDFRGKSSTGAGAEIQAQHGFTLAVLGNWQKPEQSIQEARAGSAGTFSSQPEPMRSSDPCLSLPVPRYIPGLARSTVERRLRWWNTVALSECRHGIPAGLLDALIIQESRYTPDAVSRAGAAGLAQLMPFTARELKVFDSFDPAANIDGGARYLRAMLGKFGSVPLALAAYNAGPGAIGRAGGIPRNLETPGYVTAVLGYWSSIAADPLVSIRHTAQFLGFTGPD